MQEFTFYNLAKLGGLIVGVTVANIFVFSPGLLGLKLTGEGALQTAFGVTFIVASLLILLTVSYNLLFKPTPLPSTKELKTREDFVDALGRFKRVKGLEKDIDLALDQLERIEMKTTTLFEVLKQRFDESEMSFMKFASVITSVENLFYRNMKSMLNRLTVFHSTDISKSSARTSSSFSRELQNEKASVHNEYLKFIHESLQTNEEIMLRLDKLLLEISNLDSLEHEDIENMACIQEIDSLIKQTKLYK
ncbi:hypothetical protein CIG75_09585 [Tumebacillus algifaecis]|uniref:Uncharacterized protein n=1 Tax=Tumebacillus algifaecis TaxID=1214604 RepID=A0A223D1H1_9BACL|nr:hypothetical protein [Tumebacillus algifaecis]ASS75207.1 hypothetical protein CIG75_09585 [Tumebacillus algifaecis]